MRILRNRQGYTVIEMVTVTGVLAVLTVATMSMFLAAMRSFEGTRVQAFSDSDAVIAMQRIVSDVREAKSFNIIANGERLRLVFPKVVPQGYYNKKEADMAHQFDYYLSDSTGVPGHDGTMLWRGKDANDRRMVAKNIESVAFEVDTTHSVRITVVSSNNTSAGPKKAQLVERVVYLRNY